MGKNRCKNCGSDEIVQCSDGTLRCKYCETIIGRANINLPNSEMSHNTDKEKVEQPNKQKESKKNNFGIFLLLLLLGGSVIGGYFFFNNNNKESNIGVSETDSIAEMVDSIMHDTPLVKAIKERFTEILSNGMPMSDADAVKKFFSKEFKDVYDKVNEYDKKNIPEGEIGFWDFSLWGDGQGGYGNLYNYEIEEVYQPTESTALINLEYVFKAATVLTKFLLIFENGNWVIDEITDEYGNSYKKNMKQYLEDMDSKIDSPEKQTDEDIIMADNIAMEEMMEHEEKQSQKSEVSNKVSEISNKVYDTVEQLPSFPGGDAELMKYLSSHIKYPVNAEENGIQGRVITTFIIERDGSISDVKVIKSVDPSLDKEAVRVIKSMPRWRAGLQDGNPVRVKYTMPVTFRLQ